MRGGIAWLQYRFSVICSVPQAAGDAPCEKQPPPDPEGAVCLQIGN